MLVALDDPVTRIVVACREEWGTDRDDIVIDAFTGICR
jgi:hypothetical protein